MEAQLTKQVAAKILAVMAEIGYVKKGGKNKFQNYTYVSETDAILTIREVMINHKLVATPVVTQSNTIEAGATKSGAKQFLTSILVEYTFTDTESGESLLVTTIGQGMDTGDKGAYKAMAGANKYALLKAFQIATGDDDPEAHSPEVSTLPTKKDISQQVEWATGWERQVYHSSAVAAARNKHLGCEQLDAASYEKLVAYNQHMDKKYKAKQLGH